MAEVRDKTRLNGIGSDLKDDRDFRRRRFCGKRGRNAAGSSNHGDVGANEICCERRKQLVVPPGPPVFHDEVPALLVAAFAQSLAEGSQSRFECLRARYTEIADPRTT